MIRSSALLTVAAMAMLVAGVSSASLGLIYASIAVSILAALTLGVGVLLRRRELFGEAGAGDTRLGWAAAEARAQPARDRAAAAARSADAGQPAGDRDRAVRGGRSDGARDNGGRDNGDKRGERPRKAAAGGPAAGSGRWPGAIAAKGGPLTARGGHAAGHAAGRGRSAKSASGAEPAGKDRAAHAPAPRESARGDWTRTESDQPGRAGDTAARQADDRELASRDWGDRAVAGCEPAGSGRDRQRGGRDTDQRERDQAAAWGDREAPGRGERDHDGDRAGWPDRAAPGRRGRDRDGDRAGWPDRAAPGRGRDRDRDAAARADRAAPGRGRDRDRDAAARAGFDQAGRPDREQAETVRKPAAWGDHDQAAHGRDREQAAAGQQAEAFRLPSPNERTAQARSEAARPGSSGASRTGDDFWDRVSNELTGSGSQDPVRPAWPATAGPRAMGAGSTAKAGSAQAGGEEAEPAWSSSRPAGLPPRDRGETPWPPSEPDEGHGEDERPAASERDESRWSRMVPRYVDDLAGPGQGREPAGTGRAPGSGKALSEDSAPAGAAAGTADPDVGGIWSAWSGARTARTEDQLAAAGRDVREQGGEGGRTEGGAIDRGTAPGGEPGDDETGAEDRGTDVAGDERAAAVTADRAAAPGGTMAQEAEAPEAEAPEADARGAVAADGTDEAAAGEPEARETGPDEAGASGTPAARASGRDANGPDSARAARDAAGDAAAGVPDSTADGEAAGPAEGTGEPDGSGKGDRAATSARAAAAGSGADGRQDADVPEDDDAGRAAGADGAGSSPPGDEVTIVPGVARYHRRGCILIRFLSDGDLETMTRRDAELTGSVACKACQPDKPDSSG